MAPNVACQQQRSLEVHDGRSSHRADLAADALWLGDRARSAEANRCLQGGWSDLRFRPQDDLRGRVCANWFRIQLSAQEPSASGYRDQCRTAALLARSADPKLGVDQFHFWFRSGSADLYERIPVRDHRLPLSSHLQRGFGHAVQSRNRFELHIRRLFAASIALAAVEFCSLERFRSWCPSADIVE